MREISLELGEKQYEALKEHFPDLAPEEAAEMLIKLALKRRTKLLLKRSSVTHLNQPDKG